MTTIGIPVFNAPDAVARCLLSLERCTEPEQEILVYDDASDDPRILDLLRQFCDRSARSLICSPENRGFVAAANEIFRYSAGDVVLLNSDTVVTPGWMEALETCAHSDERIATVTPFSNHAEICSFPEFCAANPEPVDPDRVAAAIARIGNAVYPPIPTAVGFCMLIRRAVLEEIGLFDVEAFGRGYGEENDFCMRARAAGYHHVLCDDAYVVHQGGASFAETGLRPGPETMARLLAKHPDYEKLVQDFIAEDPIAPRRRELLDGMTQEERAALGQPE